MRLSNQQKLAGMVAVSLFMALLIGGFLWTREPDYAVLFSIQDEKDGGQIVTSLQQQNIPYRFSEGGHAILVPQNVVHDTRLRLAAQGLPKGGLVGFELLENQKMGISQFAEQINYQRGLEGELARSIQSLAAVKGARVHLSLSEFLCVRHIQRFEKGTRYVRAANQTQEAEHGSAIHHRCA